MANENCNEQQSKGLKEAAAPLAQSTLFHAARRELEHAKRMARKHPRNPDFADDVNRVQRFVQMISSMKVPEPRMSTNSAVQQIKDELLSPNDYNLFWFIDRDGIGDALLGDIGQAPLGYAPLTLLLKYAAETKANCFVFDLRGQADESDDPMCWQSPVRDTYYAMEKIKDGWFLWHWTYDKMMHFRQDSPAVLVIADAPPLMDAWSPTRIRFL
jgi:hypothetical protein